jgi:hypothetical protein
MNGTLIDASVTSLRFCHKAALHGQRRPSYRLLVPMSGTATIALMTRLSACVVGGQNASSRARPAARPEKTQIAGLTQPTPHSASPPLSRPGAQTPSPRAATTPPAGRLQTAFRTPKPLGLS